MSLTWLLFRMRLRDWLRRQGNVKVGFVVWSMLFRLALVTEAASVKLRDRAQHRKMEYIESVPGVRRAW